MKRENSLIVDPSHSFLDMPLGEPFICSFSGGKDSVLALSLASEKGNPKGLIPRYPLWERNYADLMRNINKHEIISIISRINIEKLDSKWLGVAFNQEVYQEFMKLDIDPFGENGEFHTTVVDGKIFKNPLKYSINTTENTSINLSIHSLSDNTLKLI